MNNKMRSINEAIDLEMSSIDEKDNNFDELHSTLDKEIKFTLNSINILVGQTGSGKSRFVLREISKLKYIPNPYTQLIYVTDEGNDKTFEKYKQLIDEKIQVIRVSYANAYDTITNIVNAKAAYDEFRKSRKRIKTKPLNPTAEKLEILYYLNVDDFSLPAIHSLVLFDDATTLFSNKKNPLNSIILRNRHEKITYFFICHSFSRQSIPMYIKKNMTTLSYFGGFSSQDFSASYPQMGAQIDRKELFPIYQALGKRDILHFNYSGNKTKCEVIKLG
jgi:hypothetical protein